MTTQAETPRTDALLKSLRFDSEAKPDWNADDVCAFLKHARMLEKELNEANRELAEHKVALHEAATVMVGLRDLLKRKGAE